MRAKDITVNSALSKCLRFALEYTTLKDEERRFYKEIEDYFPVEAKVKIEQGDLAPGKGWASLGDQLADCLCEIGLDVLYKAAGHSLVAVKAKLKSDHGLFLMNSDFKEQVAEPHIFALVPYESPMHRIYQCLDDYSSAYLYNEVYVTVWLRK